MGLVTFSPGVSPQGRPLNGPSTTTATKVVYDGMITSHDVDDAPRNVRVVSNKKYNVRVKQRRHPDGSYRVNFADEVQSICSMVTNDDLVRSVTVTSARVPQVILYTDRQIQEIKSLCFDKRRGSVLSFDKTYNLGKMYVTVGVYRNLAIQRAGSGDIPIFIGPIFIHGNSDFETYAQFFCALSVRFASCDCRQLRLGSDEEASIRKAMQHAFPSASLVCCTRHLKDNFQRHATKMIFFADYLYTYTCVIFLYVYSVIDIFMRCWEGILIYVFNSV